MVARNKQQDRISALASTIDRARDEEVAAAPSAPRIVARQEEAPAPSRGPGRPLGLEKTTALLLRVPEGLHEWLTERMVKETIDQRKPVTLQTIVLQVLTNARDTSAP